MRTVKLTLSYDGTRYVGWQRQAAGTSIQALVEQALGPIEGRAVDVTGAGRTDAGVHALGQVASVRLAHPIPLDALARALNARLPDDVRVVSAEEAAAGFHARFSARAKTYRYRISTAAVASPFDVRYAWHVGHRLDAVAMAEALAVLVGRHDFSSFRCAGSDTRTATRTITAARLDAAAAAPGPAPGWPPGGAGTLDVEITADGFLRHMVRTIVGTLVEVGEGRRGPGAMAGVLDARDRARAGPTAPPRGLFLVSVDY